MSLPTLPAPAPPAPPPLVLQEDLSGTPGLALRSALDRMVADPRDRAAQLDAVVASLLAGEPRRAAGLLEDADLSPRLDAALRVWIGQHDHNVYPGGLTAEVLDVGLVLPRAGEEGSPLENLVEMLTVVGWPAIAVTRSTLDQLRRQGLSGAIGEVLAPTLSGLERLGLLAQELGSGPILFWAELSSIDVRRRAGDPHWHHRLGELRARCAVPSQVAQTYLAEGDWRAFPASAAELLGQDPIPVLAPHPTPADPVGAAGCWQQAAALVVGQVPRLESALALRRSLVARANGDVAKRMRELDLARSLSEEAADGAGQQVARVHRLVADIEAGVLSDHILSLGAGWNLPAHGPVAQVARWGRSVGSRSWVAGLGRVLDRTAQACQAAGSPTRARVAALSAAHLVAVEPGLSTTMLQAQVAAADLAQNRATAAQLRLERALADFADGSQTSGVVVGGQDLLGRLNLVVPLLNALVSRARGAAAAQVADRMSTLRDQLADAVAREDADGDSPVDPVDLAGLRNLMAGPVHADTFEAAGEHTQRGIDLLRRAGLAVALDRLAMLGCAIPMARAEAALRSGRLDEADRWSEEAVRAAAEDPLLLSMALLSARRLPEARDVVRRGRAEGRIPEELAAQLAIRAGDVDTAEQALQVLAGQGQPTWEVTLAEAEVHLERGRPDQARRLLEQVAALFEAQISELVRDPDRLDACDQPVVAALYTMWARCLAALDDPAGALDVAERLRALVDVPGLGRVQLPPAGADGTPAPPSHWSGLVRSWRAAAAGYAAAASAAVDRLGDGGAQASDIAAELDERDGALAEIEHELETLRPGWLLRRVVPHPAVPTRELSRRLPAGVLVLEYLHIGEDLLCWAVSGAGVRCTRTPVHTRVVAALVRDLHRACSAGAIADDPAGREAAGRLTELLLDPVRAEIAASERVVVVPFGPLMAVPFHVLRLDGVPLGTSHVVSFSLRAADGFADGVELDAPVRAERPLLVGDPAFDPAARPGLARLPGARREAESVARLLGVPADAVLLAEAATEPAVRARLDRSDLLHLSCHGHLDDLSPFDSALVLAGRDELTVAEVAGERFGTDLAVITGCDTGRGTATLGGDLVGLGRALLRSGVRRVIVSMWPVDDGVAPLLVTRLYEGLAAGRAPAHALADAARWLTGLSPQELDGLVAPGESVRGGSGVVRGMTDDAAARFAAAFQDATAPPAGGDAERFWAPFVLLQ